MPVITRPHRAASARAIHDIVQSIPKSKRHRAARLLAEDVRRLGPAALSRERLALFAAIAA